MFVLNIGKPMLLYLFFYYATINMIIDHFKY